MNDIREQLLPQILGEQRFCELSAETGLLLIDLVQHDRPTIRVTSEQPVRLAAAYILLAAKLIERVGRPVDDIFRITPAGRAAVDRFSQ